MQEIAGGISALLAVAEKGGIAAIAIGVAWYFWKQDAAKRLDLIRTFRQRDKCRSINARYKAYLDQAGIKVDISDIEQQFKEDAAEGVQA